MEGFLLICLVLAAYFLPAIVASLRQRPNVTAVFVLNLFLGWTFLGWIVALVWALTGEKAKTDPAEPSADTHHRCPECRELVRIDARKCRYCGTILVPGQSVDPSGSVAEEIKLPPAKNWVEVAKEEIRQGRATNPPG